MGQSIVVPKSLGNDKKTSQDDRDHGNTNFFEGIKLDANIQISGNFDGFPLNGAFFGVDVT